MKIGTFSIGFCHFLTLFSLAVSQPVFDILGKNIEFFLFRQSTFLEITLYAILIGLVVPLVLFLLTKLVEKLSGRFGSLFFGIWVLVFFVLLVSLLIKNAGVENSIFVVVIALVSGLFCASIYYRRRLFHRLVGYMLVIAVVAPALFLWSCYVSLGGGGGHSGENITVAKTDIPVFILVFDELPLSALLDANRKIDKLRYPNFARFAATSTWYRNASTTADATSLAIPAILTGNRPTPTQGGFEAASTAVNFPRSVFSMLHSTHNVVASETITRLCPDWICTGEKSQNISQFMQLYSAATDTVVVYSHLVLPEVFLQYLPAINSNWGAFQGASGQLNWDGLLFSEEQVHEAFAGISGAALNDVHYIHLNMPHHPWIHYASGKRYRSSYLAKNLNPLGVEWLHPDGHLWGFDQDALAMSRQRQSMQIAYSDKLLGGFLDAIELSGYFDEALIFVIADHGSNIAPGELFRWATPENVYDLMSVPLLVKYPKQSQPKINDFNAESIDVLPTIADVLGVKHNWVVDGHTLRDLQTKSAKTKTILRTIPSTGTDENKALPRLITLNDSKIFDKLWQDDFASSPKHKEFIYLHDRSYASSFLGASTDSLKKVEGARVVKMPRINRFNYVDLSNQYLQGYLRLEIPKFSEDEKFLVAIALNGTIQVTRFVSSTSSGAIEAILPEAAFVQGENHLEIFIGTDSDSGFAFEKLSICSANGKNGPPVCTGVISG